MGFVERCPGVAGEIGNIDDMRWPEGMERLFWCGLWERNAVEVTRKCSGVEAGRVRGARSVSPSLPIHGFHEPKKITMALAIYLRLHSHFPHASR
jgi:hypothetical protein